MKKQLISLTALAPIALAFFQMEGAIAQRMKPESVDCYFFRGEKLVIRNTCSLEGWGWTGGGTQGLTWEDGEKTGFTWGLINRGERTACPDKEDYSVDGVCGSKYRRHPKTLKRMSEKEVNNFRSKSLNYIICVQLNKKSICWMYR